MGDRYAKILQKFKNPWSAPSASYQRDLDKKNLRDFPFNPLICLSGKVGSQILDYGSYSL